MSSRLVEKLVVTLGLLGLFAWSASHFTLELHVDEIWSIWQTQGSASQIVQWTPYDWNPLYFLFLGAWQAILGSHPVIMHVSAAFFALLSGALVYAIVRHFNRASVAWVALMAFGTLSFQRYISVEVRAYGLMMVLLLLVLWFAIHYLENPKIIYLVGLVVAIVACFAIQATMAIALGLVGIWTVIYYQQRAWRWVIPLGLALIPSLLVTGQFGETANRFSGYNVTALQPIGMYATDFFIFHIGQAVPLWVGIAVLCVGVYLWQHQRPRRDLLAWLICMMVGIIGFYVLSPIISPQVSRHSWWFAVGLAIIFAYLVRVLPTPLQYGVGVLLAGTLFLPIPLDRYYYQPLPNPIFEQTLAQVADVALWGDVILPDPNNSCSNYPAEWSYYLGIHFPHGIPIIEKAQQEQRIWYVTSNGWDDSLTRQNVAQGRIASTFFGSPDCLFRLYEAPPDTEGIALDNGLRFHGYQVIEDGNPLILSALEYSRLEGHPVTVRLWWSVDEAIALDYSTGLFLIEKTLSELVAQNDGQPQLIRLDINDTTPLPFETSRWQSEPYYIEERTVYIPDKVYSDAEAKGVFDLCLAVYYWETQERVAFDGADENRCLPLLDIYVTAFK